MHVFVLQLHTEKEREMIPSQLTNQNDTYRVEWREEMRMVMSHALLALTLRVRHWASS